MVLLGFLYAPLIDEGHETHRAFVDIICWWPQNPNYLWKYLNIILYEQLYDIVFVSSYFEVDFLHNPLEAYLIAYLEKVQEFISRGRTVDHTYSDSIIRWR